MRSPPSIALLPAYPVTGGVSLMAIAVTVMTGTGRWSVDRFAVGPTAFHGEPWRLVTYVLPHVNALHLLFNVYWLWVFGTLLEEVLGHVRLFGLIALFAAGSIAADYAVDMGGIGLSGVGYGLFGMLWVLSSRDRRFAGAVDARTAETFAVWFVVCIAATYSGFMKVANVAHGAGAVLGMLVGASMSARVAARRVAAGVAIPAFLVASLAGASVLRPRVNLAHDSHAAFQLGYQAIQEGRFDDAIRNYEEAIALNSEDARSWHNLGVAQQSRGRFDEAIASFARAHEIDETAERRESWVSAVRMAVRAAADKNDTAHAADLLHAATALDPTARDLWLDLAVIERALGRQDEADEARARAERLVLEHLVPEHLVPDGGVR
jgi:membrane associated rhomboid family serine protease